MSAADLSLARELAVQACETALRHFGKPGAVRRKADGSEVTDADIEVETRITRRLRRDRPGDGILGEELGASGSTGRRWIIDPIDGTASFVAQRPQWGTHLALEIGGEIALGVITRPVYRTHWWAARGQGAFKSPSMSATASGDRLRVSSEGRIGSSRVAVWAQPPHPVLQRLAGHVELVPTDLDAILQLAEGELEAVVDPGGQPWDHAPAVVLVEEAGGRFSDWRGGRGISSGERRFSNGLVHGALEALLAT